MPEPGAQAAELTEMSQFKVINGTAKGVKTNLVVEIMSATPTEETEVSVKDAMQIACNHATHAINMRDDSPWKGMVASANTSKPRESEINVNRGLEHQRSIGSQSFLRSLQGVYDYLEANRWPTVRNGTLKAPPSLLDRGKKIADIAVEFWKAVKLQMPEPFESPEDYLLHGSLGVNVLHGVLASLLGDLAKARRPWVAAEFVTVTSNSEWFTDAGQWEKGGGEAATYGGYGGMDKLTALIIESLVPTPVTEGGVALARQVAAAGAGPEQVGQGGGQPVALLGAAAAAVEGQDGRLAVVVVPEADAGRLPLLHRPAASGLLAEVVVQAVDLDAERDAELVGGREAAAGRAHNVGPLGVAGRLGLGDGVAAGPQAEEDVGPVGVGQLALAGGVAEVVGAAQGDADAGHAPLAEVDLAVAVEVLEDGARQTGRREGHAAHREGVADRRDGGGRGVVGKRAGAVDV
jgi:hypothetical protein